MRATSRSRMSARCSSRWRDATREQHEPGAHDDERRDLDELESRVDGRHIGLFPPFESQEESRPEQNRDPEPDGAAAIDPVSHSGSFIHLNGNDTTTPTSGAQSIAFDVSPKLLFRRMNTFGDTCH